MPVPLLLLVCVPVLIIWVASNPYQCSVCGTPITAIHCSNVLVSMAVIFYELKRIQGDTSEERLKQKLEGLEVRDLADRTRKVAPLKKANGAIILGTGHLGIDEHVEVIQNTVYEKG